MTKIINVFYCNVINNIIIKCIYPVNLNPKPYLTKHYNRFYGAIKVRKFT